MEEKMKGELETIPHSTHYMGTVMVYGTGIIPISTEAFKEYLKLNAEAIKNKEETFTCKIGFMNNISVEFQTFIP